jgi:pyruvate formate lyase activating enzyme
MDPNEGFDSDWDLSVEDIFQEIKKDQIFYDQSGGGVTFSGGEPLIQIDTLTSLLELSKQRGIHTAIDTCGYIDFDRFERIIDLVDLFLFDVKIIDDTVHRGYCGKSNQVILENLTRLSQTTDNIRIRIPLIPDITDTGENLSNIADFASSLNGVNVVDLLPYNQFGKAKYSKLHKPYKLGDLRTQSKDELQEKSKHFTSHGLEVTF